MILSDIIFFGQKFPSKSYRNSHFAFSFLPSFSISPLLIQNGYSKSTLHPLIFPLIFQKNRLAGRAIIRSFYRRQLNSFFDLPVQIIWPHHRPTRKRVAEGRIGVCVGAAGQDLLDSSFIHFLSS